MKPLTFEKRCAEAIERGERAVEAAAAKLTAAEAASAAAKGVLHRADIAIDLTTSGTPEGELEALVVKRSVAALRIEHVARDLRRAQNNVAIAEKQVEVGLQAVRDAEAYEQGIGPMLEIQKEIDAFDARYRILVVEQARLLAEHVTPNRPDLGSIGQVMARFRPARPVDTEGPGAAAIAFAIASSRS